MNMNREILDIQEQKTNPVPVSSIFLLTGMLLYLIMTIVSTFSREILKHFLIHHDTKALFIIILSEVSRLLVILLMAYFISRKLDYQKIIHRNYLLVIILVITESIYAYYNISIPKIWPEVFLDKLMSYYDSLDTFNTDIIYIPSYILELIIIAVMASRK